jgi:4-oxalomesaconate hydratase
MAAQEHLWDYYTRVALNRGVQAERNSDKTGIKYAEAYQRLFPEVTKEFQ